MAKLWSFFSALNIPIFIACIIGLPLVIVHHTDMSLRNMEERVMNPEQAGQDQTWFNIELQAQQQEITDLRSQVLWLRQKNTEDKILRVYRAISFLDDGRKANGQKPLLDEDTRRYYAERIVVECGRFGIDPLKFVSLIWVESGFDNQAVSATRAVGLCQIMPFWTADQDVELHRFNILTGGDITADSLFKPSVNIRLGAAILNSYLVRYQTMDDALYHYNGAGKDSWKYVGNINAVHKRLLALPQQEG